MKTAEDRKEDFLLSSASSHLRPFAARTPTVERQGKAAPGNQDPCGSRAIHGCQVSTGRWLINRTFPLLNLRRMDGSAGHGDLAPCSRAHEAVSWVHPPLQLSVHTCQVGADRREALAPSPACVPFHGPHARLRPCLPPCPSLLCHGRLLWPPLSPPELQLARRCDTDPPPHLSL